MLIGASYFVFKTMKSQKPAPEPVPVLEESKEPQAYTDYEGDDQS